MKIGEIWAPAKVNLYLHVGKPRPGGRHPLDSLVVFADKSAADHLTLQESDKLQLEIVGRETNDDLASNPTDNIVLKAINALAEYTNTTLTGHIVLEKNLPVAAGIGGGSMDAAAILHLFNEANTLGLSTNELMSLGTPLGGDVPVGIFGAPALMRGDGDQVEPLDHNLPLLPALMVNPGLTCSTASIFNAFDDQDLGRTAVYTLPPEERETSQLCKSLRSAYSNDLQSVAIQQLPEIENVLFTLGNLPDTLHAAMSGSGATCFAIFASLEKAIAAKAHLSSKHPEWWVESTFLGNAQFDLSLTNA